MGTLIGLLFGAVIGAVIGGFVIWIVGMLGLGLEVDGFGSAVVAAILIAIVGAVVTGLLGVVGVEVGGGLIGGIVHLVISAVVLMISDRLLQGLRVAGFTGALVAAIAIGAVYWLLGIVANLLV